MRFLSSSPKLPAAAVAACALVPAGAQAMTVGMENGTLTATVTGASGRPAKPTKAVTLKKSAAEWWRRRGRGASRASAAAAPRRSGGSWSAARRAGEATGAGSGCRYVACTR